ncbi:hypothetical protein VNO77_02187 [Canavalia gladiata]|uniref:Uncharacterized protein n=1 Tax=Canavalia gladiata TaxID=3824 RepID=A0AAN9MSI3_CANGL
MVASETEKYVLHIKGKDSHNRLHGQLTVSLDFAQMAINQNINFNSSGARKAETNNQKQGLTGSNNNN